MPRQLLRRLTEEALRQRFEGRAAWAFAAIFIALSIGAFALVYQVTGRMTSMGPFYITTVLVACWAGTGPAFAALLIGAAYVAGITAYLDGSPWAISSVAQVSLLLYLACGVLMIAVCGQMRRSRDLAHRAERQLRDSNARLQLAVDGARIGTWVSDQGRGQCFWDARFMQMLGVEPGGAEIPGDALWMERVHPDDRDLALRTIRDARARAGTFDLELRVQLPRTAEVRWLSLHGRFLGGAGERALRSMGIALDVTERRALAQTLERQSTDLRALLEVLPVGIVIAHDPAASRVTLSPAFASLVGLTAEDNASLGEANRGRVPYRFGRDGKELEPKELPLQVVMRTGEPLRNAEVELLLDDGRRLQLLFNAAPLFDPSGAVRGAIGAITDVTELKSIQRELEEADRRKDAFLATLAHELRNPLAPIRYAVRLLAPGVPPGTLAQAAATIDRQSTQMARLLDDLLDLSRITRDAIELKLGVVDLRTATAEALDAARPLLEERRHRLGVSQPGEPLWVSADPTRLAQVLGNLLHNAAKYTPPGGEVHVHVEAHAGEARVRIRDSGIGIAPEDQAQVFAMFSRIAKPGSAPQQGLGIGLAITKRLVELHGGHVELRSEGLGRGAEFVIHWPRAPAPAAAAGTPTVVPLWPDAQRPVLIVDDNVDATDSLAALLRLRGIRVHTAYEGARALEMAERLRPAVIVLDLGMPGLGGLEAARAIRAEPWGRDVHLIALTGWGQEEDRRRSAQAGFDLHLTKPIDPDALLRTLADALPAAATGQKKPREETRPGLEMRTFDEGKEVR
jgi:signal transduction histidine kinase/FixJ family two-component response regulator